jgi:tRNA1Val (adenine37-N6)-methyltransferase
MFRFKQFSVSHSESTMKVGTDAVLLGAWMPVPKDCKTILEIGSGCGVIALMLSQRTYAKVTGVDLDEASVKEAQRNAERSPWKDDVQFIHENILDFAQRTTQKFEVIVSNPPFFENCLKSPIAKRNKAKHNDTLSLQQILDSVNMLLDEKGRFGVILPVDVAAKLEKLATENHLYLTKKLHIYPTPDKEVNRVILVFEKKESDCEEENIIMTGNCYKLLMDGYLLLKEENNE